MTTQRTLTLRPGASLVVIATLVAATSLGAQRKPSDVPVDFSASVQMTGPTGSAATTMKIHVERYTDPRDRTSLLNALKTNGYQAFLPAFKRAPVVGYVQIKEQKWDLRWAHQELKDLGQTLTVATAQPIYFVGGGQVDAKPRAGYEMAVIRLELDTIGMGKGTMAPAARVKPTADGNGVQVDDYAETPVPITSASRIIS